MRALAKALRPNTTLTSRNLHGNDLREGGERALVAARDGCAAGGGQQRHYASTPRLLRSTLASMTWELNKMQHFIRPGAIGEGPFRMRTRTRTRTRMRTRTGGQRFGEVEDEEEEGGGTRLENDPQYQGFFF